jgi:hypothetical protein
MGPAYGNRPSTGPRVQLQRYGDLFWWSCEARTAKSFALANDYIRERQLSIQSGSGVTGQLPPESTQPRHSRYLRD